ncbi:MAG: CRISPR-associated endonuclease Cas1 [Solirubrobacteraceae bacterium]
MSESAETTLVPARIVNEHVYCPRLAWLEWEARAFTDNLDTAEGSDAHRGVDHERGDLDTDHDGDMQATSLALSSERLGVIARIDRVERRGGDTVPVETKHGRPRRGAAPVRAPELAQIAVQALLLREHGHTVSHAEVYFPETRDRHQVEIPPDAEQWVTRLVAEIRANAARPIPPTPLIDSPKCPRCSLVGICLPDETNLLANRAPTAPRRLVAREDPRRPLYVISPAAIVRKRAGRLILEVDGVDQTSVRMLDVAHIAVFGNATVTASVMRACLQDDIPILWFSSGGWFAGYSIANGGSWVARRISQVERARSEASLPPARAFITGKIRNQRTLLRRLGATGTAVAVSQLAGLITRTEDASTLGELLGVEGTAARIYFGALPALLKSAGDELTFEGRNRRPPTDPVNAMLSFAYALLVRDTTVAALAAGLDPQIGLLHQPHFGRPSLALDLAEELRPLVADSTVIMAINNGEIRERDIVRRSGAVALTDTGRKKLIRAYERRVSVTLKHPLYGYEVTYRRAMELQARQLAAVLEGQLDEYRPLTTR